MQFAHLRHPEGIDGNLVETDTVERNDKWRTMFLECLGHYQIMRRSLPNIAPYGLYTSEVTSNPLEVALLKKRATEAAKKAERIDRLGTNLTALICSRKSRLQTALISLQNGLVRSQYRLAARVQASLCPQSV